MTYGTILVTTYPEAFLHKGGGEYELLEVAFNLRKLGLVVDIYSPFSRDIETYDTVLHFSLEAGGLPLLEQAHSLGQRIVLWPNFWTSNCLEQKEIELFNRFFCIAELVVFKSRTEYEMLKALIPSSCSILILPIGVDPCFIRATPDRLFRDSYQLSDYLLWVGIIESEKNQLTTIRAIKSLKMPVVLIGNHRDEAYYRQCRQEASDYFLFLPPMPHKSDILRAALRECQLYIEPTTVAAGKSALEAAISGASLLLAESDWAREHFGDHPTYVDPNSEESILNGVLKGLSQSPDQTWVVDLAARHTLPEILKPLVLALATRP